MENKMNAEEIFDNATTAFIDGDNAEAFRLYTEAANMGFVEAVKILAEAYENGDKLDVKQDDKKALAYYKQAVLLNDLDSFNNILNYPFCNERIVVIKELLQNSNSLLVSPIFSQKIEKLFENENEFSSDTNLILNLSSINPSFSKYIKLENLDLKKLKEILSAKPELVNTFGYLEKILALKEYENIDYEKYGNLEFILCLPGSFYMGSFPEEPGHCNDEVLHKVTISKPFLIAKYPVNQDLYKVVMGDNPSANVCLDNPVEQVSFKSATDFCRRLTAEMINVIPKDFMFNLPTEAQWEYACKAGTEQGGIDLSDYEPEQSTHPVDDGKPNNWQICDMLGNVSEWCRSWYYKYDSQESKDPTGPMIGQFRVCRGGSFKEPKINLRAAKRFQFKGTLTKSESPEIGFRIILESKR